MAEDLLKIWRTEMELGTNSLGKQQYEKAERHFLRSSKIAREILVPEVLAFSLRLLATVKLRLGKFVTAERGFNEALGICRKIDNLKGIAEALAGLASVAVAKGELIMARDYYEQSIEVYPVSSPPLRLGILYSDLGQVYSKLKSWDKAESAYDKAIHLCFLHNYPRGEAELYVLKGELYYRQGKLPFAIQEIRKACRIFGTIFEWENLANALQYLAFIYYELGRIKLARTEQQRAFALGLKIKSKEENSETSYLLSKIEQELGLYFEAEYYLKLSIQLYPRQDVGLAIRYQNLGILAALKADFSSAEAHYLKAADFYKLVQDEQKLKELYESLACIMEGKGRKEEALKYAEYQSRIEENTEQERFVALEGFQRLGYMYEVRQDYLMALQFYWKALEIARDHQRNEAPDLEVIVQKLSRKIRYKNRK